MKYRILEIIPTLDRSGAEKQLTLLATGLPRDRFDVEVAVLTRSGPLAEQLDAEKIPYTVVGKRSKFSFGAITALKKIIRRFQPDLVHTWLFAGNAYGRQAALSCGVKRIVCGERCVDPWKKWWHFAIDRHFARRTDCVAVNSAGIRDFYVAARLPAEKFVLIPNAVLAPLPSPLSRREVFDALKIPVPSDVSPPKLIGMVARLWPQKRIDEAIRAAEQLAFAGVDFHLVIFGDGPERERLLRYRDTLNLFSCIHFVGHREDVADFMPHCDLLWCTSAYEGQSNSILEAMAVGVPVVASDIPGNRELVVDHVTGRLIPEYGDDRIRRRTAFCRESFALLSPEGEERRCAFGIAAKERIVQEFGLQRMIDRYATLYTDLIEGRDVVEKQQGIP